MYLVKVILVKLAHETCEIRMPEDTREDMRCEFGYVCDIKSVARSVPRDDLWKQ